MSPDGHAPEVRTPLQSVVGFASVVCFLCFLAVNATISPVIQWLQVGWTELLAYALIPVSATLTVLYRSDARRDLSNLTRLGYLLLISCVIFVVVCLAVAAVISIACIFVGLSRQH